MELVLACIISFIAGVVDAAVGGGALIILPSVLVLFPSFSIYTALGVNKFATFFSRISSAAELKNLILLDKKLLLQLMAVAFCSGLLGAKTVVLVDPKFLEPAVVILLFVAILHSIRNRNFGGSRKDKVPSKHQAKIILIISTVMGFYDGFFGPGAGSFMIFLFISILGFDLMSASATSKFISLASNFAALIFFAQAGFIEYNVAVPMACFASLGGLYGAKLVILKGSYYVRSLFILVMSAVFLRLSYDLMLH